MFIALERIFSTTWPAVYHKSGLNLVFLAIASVISYSFGFCAGHVLYIQGLLTEGILMYNLIDVTTLIINRIGISYCEGRYRDL
ncbi:hypothetical protein PMAYCL1PPCAC_16731 [Pristionchus mayeri]|uniref:G protein-coupled receptor n=1 Tax=Pristionchus mayeri TaxID=1317129 RepID=A0AAN5CLA3_9BILA|nr:hypothetical protein PMAYCL1PPCAC_16731 [Pristionchus mayeri]